VPAALPAAEGVAALALALKDRAALLLPEAQKEPELLPSAELLLLPELLPEELGEPLPVPPARELEALWEERPEALLDSVPRTELV